jgi:hypothetical protein
MLGLSQVQLFWERSLDTKVLVGWSGDTIVISFRGTASLRNALADLQARLHILELSADPKTSLTQVAACSCVAFLRLPGRLAGNMVLICHAFRPLGFTDSLIKVNLRAAGMAGGAPAGARALVAGLAPARAPRLLPQLGRVRPEQARSCAVPEPQQRARCRAPKPH